MIKEFIKDVFGSKSNLSVFIAAVSVFISAISTIIAFFANRRNAKQYTESNKPKLSMKLVNFNGFLYLQIKNTGKAVAKDVHITPLEIKNNGDNESKPNTDGIFALNFELYPEETVQSEVGTCFQTICSDVPFPQLFLTVEYAIEGQKKRIKYNRSVTYAPAYDNKIVADVNIDKREIEHSLKTISRASVRTANYFDGCQVAEFDELNILAGKSLKNDLLTAFDKPTEPVLSRVETIDNALNKRTK